MTSAPLFVTLAPGLSLVVKATLILAIGLLTARLAIRARAAVRHLVLAATFAALFAMPFIDRAAPPTMVPVTTVQAPASVETASVRASGRETIAPGPIATASPVGMFTRVSIGNVAGVVWLIGCLTCLVPIVRSNARHRQMRRTGLPCPPLQAAVRDLALDAGIERSIDVLIHEGVRSPLTFGLRRPVVVLPPDARAWDDADLRRALVHELDHIRRADAATHTAAGVVSAMWWFHPLAWAARRRLDLEAERACDDAVLIKEENMDYAEQLVSLAERLSAEGTQPAVGMANRSDLAQRVSALLDSRQRRGRASAGAVVATTIAATLVVTAIAPMQAVARVAAAPERVAAAPPVTVEQSRRQRGLDRELYEAAEDGDVDGVHELLRAGANVNAAIDGDGSALIAATRRGRVDIARILLDAGADPNLGVPGDGSPLIAAAVTGRVDLATLYLDRGAKVDQVVDGDENALIQASGAGHLGVVRLLVARGADVNARVRVINYRDQEEWRSPLQQARLGRHDAVVAYLLSVGAR